MHGTQYARLVLLATPYRDIGNVKGQGFANDISVHMERLLEGLISWGCAAGYSG